MLIMRRRGWEIAECFVTPERLVSSRRGLMAGALALSVAPAVRAQTKPGDAAKTPTLDSKYPPGRPITDEKHATTYNNYYEFSEGKDLWRAAQALPTSPWHIKIGGMVQKEQEFALDDLLKKVQLEQRIYRHRCVEAWAMTAPWTGFPLNQLVKIADPLSSAKYIVFETIQDKSMPGLNSPFYPWPYIEGLTIEEAGNDLAFIATGMYGKELPKQNGGPIRLVVPWKYGFKSAKAIIKVTFTDKRPQTFWEEIQPSEYGFWANVNPDVPHPRWSQARERLIGSDEMVRTKIYNGYGEFVASLYTGLKSEKLFM